MKKSTLFLSLLLMILLFTVTSLANTTNNAQKAAKRKAPKSDADIQTCITERITAAQNLQGDNISVVVANRAVTLNGTTSSAKNKNTAASLARRCNVSRVTNNLEVRAAATKPNP